MEGRRTLEMGGGEREERELIRDGVCVPVVKLIWILSSMQLWDWQVVSHSLEQTGRALNIRCRAEEMKQHTTI